MIKYKQMAKSQNTSSQQSLYSTKTNFFKNPDKSSIISNKSSSDFNRTIQRCVDKLSVVNLIRNHSEGEQQINNP